MSRAADELILAAVNEHQRLMDDGKDPDHVFYVTQEELLTLRDLPPVYHPALNANRDRLCGFMLNIVSELHQR